MRAAPRNHDGRARALPCQDAKPNTRCLPIAVVIAAGIVAALQVGKVSIGLPALRTDLEIGLGTAGWVMGVVAVIGAVFGIPVGAAVHRFGDRVLIIAGLALIALGSAGGASAYTVPILLSARVLEGAGVLLIIVGAPVAIDRFAAARHRDLIFGIWGTFMPVGIVIAYLTAPLVAGWRPFWFANAVLAVVTAIGVGLFVQHGGQRDERLSWRSVGRDAQATIMASAPRLLACSFALYNFMYLALVSFLPALLSERMDLSISTAGLLSAIVVGANISGNIAAGAFIGRGVRRSTLIALANAVMGATALGIFLSTMPAPLVVLLCIIFSGVAGLLPATVLGAAPKLAPEVRLAPISTGLVIQGNNFGQIVGPATVGGVVAAGGWDAAAIPVAAAGLAGAALALGFRRILDL